MANTVVHFEIFASDVAKARKFYEQVFGWRFEAGGPPDMYHIHLGIDGDPGLRMGLIAKRTRQVGAPELSPNAFRCTISVRSIEETTKAVQAAGGSLRSPVVDIPHVGKVCEIADTDNNISCIMQYASGHPMEAK
ncbi:MAG TPA: VOC family protein [Candidatus Acidoferrum sp.]|nr:VOC family protein [Candidatus Acidoferrum sp.]